MNLNQVLSHSWRYGWVNKDPKDRSSLTNKQRCPSITIDLILIQVKNKMSFKQNVLLLEGFPTTITKQLFPEYYGWYLLSSPCNSSSSSIHALVLPALIWHLMTTHPPTSHLVSEDVWGGGVRGVSIMVRNSLVNSFAPCWDCLLSTHAKKGKPYLTYLSALAKLLLQRQHTPKRKKGKGQNYLMDWIANIKQLVLDCKCRGPNNNNNHSLFITSNR